MSPGNAFTPDTIRIAAGLAIEGQHIDQSMLAVPRSIRADQRTMALVLPFWNKPAPACLSSRIPYEERIG